MTLLLSDICAGMLQPRDLNQGTLISSIAVVRKVWKLSWLSALLFLEFSPSNSQRKARAHVAFDGR